MISKNLLLSSLIQPPNQLPGAGIIQSYLTDKDNEFQRGQTKARRNYLHLLQPLCLLSILYQFLPLRSQNIHSFIHSFIHSTRTCYLLEVWRWVSHRRCKHSSIVPLTAFPSPNRTLNIFPGNHPISSLVLRNTRRLP
uniref:Uncharacterized protein n=1 Tax=Pipistrellus kuhlii TaxID=59472 RepID=A0A7J7XAX2_PIPKU|nr:hypothetical protein mPipKuh1_010588 [Pipistrellus kuhlii]